ncbi:hypothetical protein QSV34_14120 [Porticoccus sp. W117]|uniref:hypothetical protein n=1 Tax=Porticoccus sp. W117 TaxID=3054777 RepID=UPI002593BB7F|nr:hypothetical protein [Porticoccus sp. W117]MDM3872485.1 hypothetical protein [Porticoccus sp. W117]
MKKANILGALFVLCLVICAWGYFTDSELDPEFQRWIEQEREQPPEADNAFFYFMGIGIPEGLDPVEAGKTAYRKVQTGESDYMDTEDALELPSEKHLTGLLNIEILPERLADIDSISELLSEYGEVLARYKKLMEYPDFSTLTRPSIEESFPPYNYMLIGQQLNQLQAIENIAAGQLDRGVKILLDDLANHRRILIRADTLISKLIAVKAITRNVKLLHGLGKLTEIEIESHQGFLALIAPLTEEERDFSKAYQREAILGRNTFLDLAATPLWGEPKQKGWSLSEAITMRLFFKPNHASNMAIKQWRYFLEVSSLSAQDFYRTISDSKPDFSPGIWDDFYNPVGSVLSSVSSPSMDKYPARIHDLDCLFGLVRASLKSKNIEQIAQQKETNPYDGGAILIENGVARFNGPFDEHQGGRSLRVAW